MQITPSVNKAMPKNRSVENKETLFLDLDPFSDAKQFIGDTVEMGGDFVKGAIPVYAMQSHFESMIMGGNSDSNVGRAGMGLNAAGTLSLLVAGGQALFGADPTIALGVAAATLTGSGVANVMTNR